MVIWTKPAKSDLKAIYNFIALESIYYAKEVAETIVNLTIQLKLFPHQGRIVPELKKSNIRELLIYSYRLVYEVKEDSIYILALVNMRQKLNSPLLKK